MPKANALWRSILKSSAPICIGWLSLWILASSWVAAQSEEQGTRKTLFSDSFETVPPGSLMPVVGPHPEYHFVREAIPSGTWSVTTFDSASETQTAWRSVRDEHGKASLQQSIRTKAKHWHPMVVAGDPHWRDYRVEASFSTQERSGRVGVAFRQKNDRCYYFAGIDHERAILLRVQHESDFQVPDEKVLSSAVIDRQKDDRFELSIQIEAGEIHAIIAGVDLKGSDPSFTQGRIALLSNVPAQFDRLQVTCSHQAWIQLESERTAARKAEQIASLKLPRPVLWKKILTPQFGADRNIRFGDLNGDGRKDLLIGQITHHGPTDSNSEIGCMTAIDLDGKVLWRQGNPDRWKHHLTNDVAFQIHDLDGDGAAEVVYCQGHEIIIAEGGTGKRIRSRPTPNNPSQRVPFNRFPKILGDSLFFADLRGSKHRKDILIKDRYQNLWAFDDQLNDLWHVECNTGHFAFPIDANRDGCEEIHIGYSKLLPDGKKEWSHDDRYKDHVDSVAVIDLDGDGSLETIWGASDEGFILLDHQGVPRVHHRLGHVQNLSVADFRPDLPGLEIVSANFWKNQGLIHLFDARGNILFDWEPRPEHGSSIVPVFWSGDGSELILIGPDPEHGGLWDGYGRRVVRLPADGHPTKAYDALDLVGDHRDEIIVWDSQEIWIYTQATIAEPLADPPVRNPLSNESNYRSRVSIPASFGKQTGTKK